MWFTVARETKESVNLILRPSRLCRHSRHRIPDGGLPPRDGEEILVLHSDVDGHEEAVADDVVDEALAEPDGDGVKGDAEVAEDVEEGELGAEDVDDGEHAHLAVGLHQLLRLKRVVDSHAGDHAEGQETAKDEDEKMRNILLCNFLYKYQCSFNNNFSLKPTFPDFLLSS